jgi:diguanylate cyclase (GGDEF)-like protein/PAS domain S-box-containing protein
MITLRRIIYESFILVVGVSITTIGLLALLGWILDTPVLTSWQTNTLPMAPFTALLSILFGGVFVFNAKRPTSRITFMLTTFCAWIGAMIALWLFTLRILNSYWSIELLGLNITGMLGDAPIGYISPITALCFLLANLAFLITLPQGSHCLWRGYLASILAGLLTLVSFTLLLSYFFGLPLPISNGLIRPALNTSFILLLMGIGLLIVAHLRIMFSDDESEVIEIDRLIYVLFFSALTASILIAAFQSYRTTEIKFRQGLELQLLAVSELKTRQLSQWRIERLSDGALAQSTLINSAVRQHFETTSNISTQGALQDWFERILHDSHYGYDRGFLLDAQGVVRMSMPTKLEPIATTLKNSAMTALRTNQVMFQDFFRDEYDQKVYLALLVPIPNEQDSKHPLGVIVLRIDPNLYLYPFIKQWPTISTTAETLLVRRDGNEVLFLNDLRFSMDAALKKRIPVKGNSAIPAVKAVIGQRGVVDGKDYNGKQVIAVLSNIPDTSWLLVTKINNAEVYAPLDTSLRLTALLVISMIFGVGVALFLLRIQHLKEIDLIELESSYAALRNQELHSSLLQTTLDGYFLIDNQGGLLEVNDTYCRMSGYIAEELLNMRVTDLEVNATDQSVIWRLQITIIQNQDRYETKHRRKDGSVFDVEVSIRQLSNSEGQFIVFLQDISERKKLALNNQFLASIIRSSDDAILSKDLNGNITSWNLGCQQLFGYTAEEMIGQPMLKLFPLDRIEEEQFILHKINAGLRIDHFETIRLDKNGLPVDVSVTMSPIFDHAGNVIGASKIARNITERKLDEAKLRLSSSVFANAWEGILITTTDGTIVDVNDALSRITGYSRNEVLGKNPRIFSAGLQDQVFYAELWNSLIEKGHWYGEIWNRRKSGEMYAIIETISVVKDTQGIPRHYVGMLTDITQLKLHENELMHIAHYDPLTNLPNRILLADRMHQGINQVHRRNKSLAVTFVDLDGFKAINDNYGHQAGDRLLIAIAARMGKNLREGDTFARIGGDEFVAVLLDLDTEDTAIPMLNRLLAAASEPVQVGDISLQVSASLGVAFYPQEQEVDADKLLRQADQAMYQAKAAGRNRYHVFDAVLDNSIRVRHESLGRIHVAIIEQEFVLYYQPKVNMRTGVIVGAEALIRWNHPEKGLLSPELFLPEIEDHPLAIALGEWVIDSALIQLELWHSQGFSIPISVNVGARQLQQTDFVIRLHKILKAHPSIAPSYLEFEVLETSALEDITKISHLIETCQEIGINFALDDFGTGYSSLTYLKLLPVTLLKIDQSFVRDILVDSDDLAIIEAVVGLGRTFRRQVIAEGVETIKHGTLLLEHGCELGQGYGIARPMPAEKLPEWARTWRPNLTWVN